MEKQKEETRKKSSEVSDDMAVPGSFSYPFLWALSENFMVSMNNILRRADS